MNQARQSFEKPRLSSLPMRMWWLTETKALARSMNTAAQYCFLSMAVKISFRTLGVVEVHPWPARKPDCIAEKVLWDSKWSVICLLTWLSKTLERQGRIDIRRSVAVCVKSVLPLDDRSCFPIFGNLRRHEREVEHASSRGCNNFGRLFLERKGPDWSRLKNVKWCNDL